ncbi:hypothetical protein ACOME3_004881 [Neoechinorhynchus agilis]
MFVICSTIQYENRPGISVGESGDWEIRGIENFHSFVNEMKEDETFIKESKPIFVWFYEGKSPSGDFDDVYSDIKRKCSERAFCNLVQLIRTDVDLLFKGRKFEDTTIDDVPAGSILVLMPLHHKKGDGKVVAEFSETTEVRYLRAYDQTNLVEALKYYSAEYAQNMWKRGDMG